MKLEKKFQILLLSTIFSVPLLVIFINIVMYSIYQLVSKTTNNDKPFHESLAYPTMHVLFFLSFILLAFILSKLIHSLLNKINVLNQTIKRLASEKEIPNKLEVSSNDEMGDLIRSVNLLIERTTYREIELKQQEGMQREYLNKLRHDINTPLTAIQLQLFYLEGEHPSLELESVYKQIHYISELTNEVSLKSTHTLNDSYIEKKEVNIHQLLSGMVKKWEYLYSIHNIELRYLALDQDIVWMSHALWLQRLFDNVFQNTLKHSNAEWFEITLERGGISMRDNGLGFDREEECQGLGLKVIEDLTRSLHISYTLNTSPTGTAFIFQPYMKEEIQE
jgi:signal transduction histidine kinase